MAWNSVSDLGEEASEVRASPWLSAPAVRSLGVAPCSSCCSCPVLPLASSSLLPKLHCFALSSVSASITETEESVHQGKHLLSSVGKRCKSGEPAGRRGAGWPVSDTALMALAVSYLHLLSSYRSGPRLPELMMVLEVNSWEQRRFLAAPCTE